MLGKLLGNFKTRTPGVVSGEAWLLCNKFSLVREVHRAVEIPVANADVIFL